VIASLLPYRWIAVALLAAAAVGYFAILHAQLDGARVQLAHERATRVQEHADAERAARAATERARLEEQRRTAAQKEATDESQRLSERARSDAAGAAAERERVLVAAAGAARRCDATRDPGAPASGPAAESPGLVLADVLGRADARAGELAAALDAAHIAGQLCERSYDALRPESGAP